jgi:hypothetical protein
MKFRKKPVVIEAFQWMIDQAPQWWRTTPGITVNVYTRSAFIPTLEGLHEAKVGDWIIKGIKGELYPCKPDIFWATYEKAEEEP